PLTQYDAGATPMFASFRREPVGRAYTVLNPAVDLLAKNAATAPHARESARMNFKEYDRAPEDELNRILWAAAKPGVPYPAPIHVRACAGVEWRSGSARADRYRRGSSHVPGSLAQNLHGRPEAHRRGRSRRRPACGSTRGGDPARAGAARSPPAESGRVRGGR